MVLIRQLLVLVFVAALGVAGAADEPMGRAVVVSGPPEGLLSIPFHRMIEEGVFLGEGRQIRYVAWKNPDQLRALIAGGQVDFIGLPCNVAANFRARGIDVRLLNISVWKALWIMAREPGVESLDDLGGKRIIVPMRGDLPEIIFRRVVEKHLSGGDDGFEVRYVAGSLEAAQQLMLGHGDFAVVAEPICSLVIARSSEFEGVGVPYRAIDLQAEWGRLYGGDDRLPIGGLAWLAEGSDLSREEVRQFNGFYSEAVAWCVENPDEADLLARRHASALPEGAVADALGAAEFRSVDSARVRGEIEVFFRILMEEDAEMIGGRLPEAGYYWDSGSEESSP